jgi:DNA-binding CsgD family transcriptional regulator
MSYAMAVHKGDPLQRLMAEVVATVNAAVPAALVALAMVDRRGRQTDAVALVPRFSHRRLQRAHESYATTYWRTDPFSPHHHAASHTTVATAHGIGGQDEFMRSLYGQDLVLGQGLRWETAIYLRDRGPIAGMVTIFRAIEDPDFTRAEIAFLRRSQPFIELAFVNCLRLDSGSSEATDVLDRLTPRECEVALLVASGHTNAEVARELLLSEATVKTHLVRTFAKLDVRSRTELAAKLGAGSNRDEIGQSAGTLGLCSRSRFD